MSDQEHLSAPQHERLRELVVLLLEGQITDEDQRELGEMLTAHKDARDLYREYVAIDRILNSRMYRSDALLDESSLGRAPMVALPSNRRDSRHAWKAVAAATVLMTAIVVMGIVVMNFVSFWKADPESLSEPIAARITKAENARWEDRKLPTQPGGVLHNGKAELKTGVVHLTTESGVELVLEAPVQFEFIGANRIRVDRGTLAACVPEEAIGFRLTTPTTDIVDLGTEFGVVVEGDGASEVHVFRGVVVARPLAGETAVPIYRSEAARIGPAADPFSDRVRQHGGQTDDLVAIDIAPHKFPAANVRLPEVVEPVTGLQTDYPPLLPGAYAPLPSGSRVLFLGDRIIEQQTHILLIQQVLESRAPAALPLLINGYRDDDIGQHEERMETHILAYRPTHVVLAFGRDLSVWQSLRLPPDEFAMSLRSLIRRIQREGIEVILATSVRLNDGHPEAQAVLDEYNQRVRSLAEEYECRLADVDRAFADRSPSEEPLLLRSRLAPSFAGSRLIAGTLLKSMGYMDYDVPRRLDIELLPGVVQDWRIRVVLAENRFDDSTAATVEPDATWEHLHLPQLDRFSSRVREPSHFVGNQHRAQGFATNLHFCDKVAAPHMIQGVAAIDSETDRSAYLNTGATLQRVWLNGKKISDVQETGRYEWQAGRERIPIRLKAGRNKIVIEARNSFFVSVTETDDW